MRNALFLCPQHGHVVMNRSHRITIIIIVINAPSKVLKYELVETEKKIKITFRRRHDWLTFRASLQWLPECLIAAMED